MNEVRSGKTTTLTTEKLVDLGYVQPNYLEVCFKLFLLLAAGNFQVLCRLNCGTFHGYRQGGEMVQREHIQ